MDSQRKRLKKFSFEFFPPRTPEATVKLEATFERLAALRPSYFSVTFGAAGSTHESTFETVNTIRKKTHIEGVPHISCIGMTIQEITEILQRYQQAGLAKLLALRGDLPSGSAGALGQLRYASELVELIRKETGDFFHIEVAAYPEFHPQAASVQDDLNHFKRKIDAGANGAVTQYFYNPDAYFRFIDSCEKLGVVDIPIVPGVMPITNCTQLARFSEACGAEIPRWLLKRLRAFGDDRAAIREFGIDVTTELCDHLLSGGAPGLHFYTMNQFAAPEAIWKNLNIDQYSD